MTTTRDRLMDTYLNLQGEISAAEAAGNDRQADRLMRDGLRLAERIRAVRLETQGA